MTYVKHPYSDEIIEGHQLGYGDRVLATDVYASTDGKFKPPGKSVGIRIESVNVVWVRPAHAPDPKQQRIAYKTAVTAK